MARISALDPNETSGELRALFDLIKGRMGRTPNMIRTLGHSPAALTGYLGFNAGLKGATIGSRSGELIALAVSGENGSAYCNAAHSYVAARIGLDAETIRDAKLGVSSDPRTNTELSFVKELMSNRGAVSDKVIMEMKDAGYTDGEILEIVAQVSLSIFSNYVNIAASTEIDVPGTNVSK